MTKSRPSARGRYRKIQVISLLILGCFVMRPLRGNARVHAPARCSVPPVCGSVFPACSPDTTLRPKDLKKFEGYYKFQFEKGTDAYIHITATQTGLVLKQMWDGKEIAFTPQTALEFINDDGHFPLKFTKAKDGSISQVLAFNRDLWNRATDYKPPVK
jgi:hypothetical protein